MLTVRAEHDAPFNTGTQDDGSGYGATLMRSTFGAEGEMALDADGITTGRTARSQRTHLPQYHWMHPQRNPNTDPTLISLIVRVSTWARMNFKDYETMVTNQSVEALPGIAGVRWYEIRRAAGVYSLHQQGTYAPSDGVHRWMGSIAQDRMGNMAVGYSVSNGVDVYPGIRYTGRMAGDALGQMTLGEGVIINGTGVQTTTNSRWGDYTSMNVDPVDDCTPGMSMSNRSRTAAAPASSSAAIPWYHGTMADAHCQLQAAWMCSTTVRSSLS
jgi:hypothetical protein